MKTSGAKSISAALLDMKFMQRTKNRLAEEEKRKKEEAMKKAFLCNKRQAKDQCAKRLKGESDKEEPSSSGFIFEQRYEILEDLRYGRMSFGGFNPEVEKLMKYFEDLKKGIQPDEDVLGEKDVSDEEMAATLHGGPSSTLAKKFAKFDARQQRREDERHNKILIDESCPERNRKRPSDRRRAGDDEET
ncbi:M-phase phosphoprotein 6 [Toxocara canis]|uniref:M-phase phosphoprotein 6 n=2 Tax=Toxocara canis TaxID=6265 RepID=A0A0B2VK60_TOXCA|nr:M-phase phosphoprotein 6 [Toxocara canis]VDM46675.1 unnamed protein product [Toxocara canis]